MANDDHFESRAQRVDLAMKHFRLTQAGLAEAAGTSRESISRFLRGKSSGDRILPDLAEALGVSIRWLLTGEDPPPWLDKSDSWREAIATLTRMQAALHRKNIKPPRREMDWTPERWLKAAEQAGLLLTAAEQACFYRGWNDLWKQTRQSSLRSRPLPFRHFELMRDILVGQIAIARRLDKDAARKIEDALEVAIAWQYDNPEEASVVRMKYLDREAWLVAEAKQRMLPALDSP